MKLKYFFLAASMILMLTACKQPDSNSSGDYTPAIGERLHMVQFKLESLTDKSVLDSRQLENQVLLVTFFATWCPPCIQEIPTFIDLQETYTKKGFTVLAFSVDEGDPAPLYKLIEKYGINYPVLFANEDVTQGVGGVTGIPVTFLVNRKGEIVKKYLGYVEHDILEDEIKSMLAAG